jgi:beta-aspartyl-peptidase (threonine type)
MLGTPMPNTPSQPTDELRFRKRFFYVGCLANILLFAVLVVICVVFLYAIARTFDRSPPASDEKAIRRVLDDQVAAWNKGDLDGFMKGYWRDEKLTFISGDKVTQGWEATRERYQKKYFTPDAQGKLAERGDLSFEELQVESFGPNVALVRGRYVLKLDSGKATGRFTLVFRKFADGWKVTSDHTSAADKPAEKKE